MQIQEAGATTAGRGATLNGPNPQGTVALDAPVVIGPGESKTFTINLNSGALNSLHNINGFSLNGTLLSSSGPYLNWAEITHGLAGEDAAFTADAESDSMDNGLEFVLGGDPNVLDLEILPFTWTTATDYYFLFRRNDDAAYLNPVVEYGSDLENWSTAVDGENGISVQEIDDEIEEGIDEVTVRIPLSLASGGQLYYRLTFDSL